jgi:hypothetical protein
VCCDGSNRPSLIPVITKAGVAPSVRGEAIVRVSVSGADRNVTRWRADRHARTDADRFLRRARHKLGHAIRQRGQTELAGCRPIGSSRPSRLRRPPRRASCIGTPWIWRDARAPWFRRQAGLSLSASEPAHRQQQQAGACRLIANDRVEAVGAATSAWLSQRIKSSGPDGHSAGRRYRVNPIVGSFKPERSHSPEKRLRTR